MNGQHYGFSDPRYEQFPPVVQIALVSGVCPSNCRYCPAGRKNMGELSADIAAELKEAFFDFALFRKVADEIARYPWSILRIHSWGEPMSHPEYIAMIAYAKSVGVRTVTSFTNGIFLKQHVEGLLDGPIDLLEVSTDAADAESYTRWRRNPHFDDVVEGVRLLFNARNVRVNSPTRIVISGVDHPDFQEHRQQFEELWGHVCDKVIVRPYHTYAGRIEDPYERDRITDEYFPCVQLWERFSISTFGVVNACFNDWGDREIVGDLCHENASIARIWRGKPFEAIRADTLKGPHLHCCKVCSGPSLSSWGQAGYQHWVRELLESPPNN